ncbi:helix-turn-helix transcriptional regulator [Nocardioides bruguierae]|uniref:helix-turn-helix transcriptional regulator n=1 Tax=Nocardioides bruguierae TaxID=2945102 RepID=UPI0020227ED5|nr:helix-turn-helix transcriptional regulator [Nocardioides bruguierae]MCL8027496.1 helix-turn-helix transcriptional regulator [Nocardioides bruguierae]
MKPDKSEVRDFLVSRRAKVTPEQAGLSHYGGNRRVPGLRREEVALLAGVSIDYYTKLEKGNLSGVSDSVLHSVAQALQLDDAERSHLIDLARSANTSPARSTRRPTRRTVRAGLQMVLDQMPGMPAFVTNGRMEVLAWNALGDAMHSGLFTRELAAGRTPSFARFNALDEASQHFYVDWEKAIATTASMLRTEVGRCPGDPSLSALIGELCTRSDAFATQWARHDVRIHRSGLKHFVHPDVGELALHYEVLPVLADEGQAITVYAAEVGSPTHEKLQLLASMSATQRAERIGLHVEDGAADPEDEHTF